MNRAQEQFIAQMMGELKKNAEIGGNIGSCIGAGAYGFVCEWKKDASSGQVVKVLDGQYRRLARDNKSSLKAVNEPGDVFGCDPVLEQEYAHASQIAKTQCRNLMPLLAGSRWIDVDGRQVALLVMPRLSTLDEYPLNPQRQLEQAMRLAGDCLNGLRVLHTAPALAGKPSLVHNDLKPNNIFVGHDPQNRTEYFIIGDYNSCMDLNEKSDATLQQLELLNQEGKNPYYAPGKRAFSSDIWSLGWIMWYWLNGKKHPSAEEIRLRRTDPNRLMCPLMQENMEIWELFLRMTAWKPEDRYQTAGEALAALEAAQTRREKRLREKAVSDTRAETRTNDVLVFGGLAGLGVLLYNLFKSPDGEQKKNAPQPATGRGYAEQAAVKRLDWADGTRFDYVETDEGLSGTMTFPGGEQHKGRWQRLQEGGCEGYYCQDTGEICGWGRLSFAGDVTFEGAIFREIPQSGRLRFRNRALSYGSEEMVTAWNNYFQIALLGGCFEGDWSADGYPETGIYRFSGDRRAKVDFVRGVETDRGIYTGMRGVKDRMMCGWGVLEIPGQAHVSGEFEKNALNGCGKIDYLPTGACFDGRWAQGKPCEGVLTLRDGRKIESRRWKAGDTQLRGGMVARGLFALEQGRLYGIGTVDFRPAPYLFDGEIFGDQTEGGAFRDAAGNWVHEDTVNAFFQQG